MGSTDRKMNYFLEKKILIYNTRKEIRLKYYVVLEERVINNLGIIFFCSIFMRFFVEFHKIFIFFDVNSRKKSFNLWNFLVVFLKTRISYRKFDLANLEFQ